MHQYLHQYLRKKKVTKAQPSKQVHHDHDIVGDKNILFYPATWHAANESILSTKPISYVKLQTAAAFIS